MLLLSAISTSPAIPSLEEGLRLAGWQTASVSASFGHGIRMVSSSAPLSVAVKWW